MSKKLPTLVMLPGTLCDARVFARQKRALRQVARVRVIDYRKLRQPTVHHSSPDWVARLLSTLPEKFSLAGFSLGGIYALEILRRAPDRIERLAMIASNARAANAKGLRNSKYARRLWQRRTGGGPQAIVTKNLSKYFHHNASRQKHEPLLRSMARKTARTVALTQFSWAGTRPDGLTVFSEFMGPILIVSGEKDPLCPHSWQKSMSQAQPHARWIALPGVGHFVPLEAPARLSNALESWLRNGL